MIERSKNSAETVHAKNCLTCQKKCLTYKRCNLQKCDIC